MVGRVGSGKSSLLAAALGEMEPLDLMTGDPPPGSKAAAVAGDGDDGNEEGDATDSDSGLGGGGGAGVMGGGGGGADAFRVSLGGRVAYVAQQVGGGAHEELAGGL